MTVAQSSSQNATAPVPVRLMSSREIAEMALQKIGAYTANDTGADTAEVERTLQWMEVSIAHISGVNRLQWLIPTTAEFDLEDDIAAFDLEDVMGSEFPPLGIAYPIRAYVGTFTGLVRGAWVTATSYALEDRVTVSDVDYLCATAHTSGTFATDLAAGYWIAQQAVSFHEVPIVRRGQYESHPDKLTSGVPEEIYIDRLNDNKSLFVYPVQDSSVNVRVRLTVQTYPRSVRGQSAEDTSGDTAHGFDVTWQKWLILETAAAIGNGPVRRLDAQTLKGIKDEAAIALVELNGAQNREKITHKLRRTRRYGG